MTNREPDIDPQTRSMLQATAIVEMLTGLGTEAGEERVAYYLRLLAAIPPLDLRAACDKAVLDSDSGFPPSPGAILRAASESRKQRVIADRDRKKRAQIAAYRRDAEASDPATPLQIEASITELVTRLKAPQPDPLHERRRRRSESATALRTAEQVLRSDLAHRNRGES